MSSGIVMLNLSLPNVLRPNHNPIFSRKIPASFSFNPLRFGDFKERVRNLGRLSLKSLLLDFPLLPFEAHEVLVPSERKTLHLYEARYLALLEKSLVGKKLFVHFVLEPVLTSGPSSEASFAARYGCLVLIESVEPYLRGLVIPLQDNVPDCQSKINSAVTELKDTIYNLRSLEIKLKDSKDEPLQTHLTNCVRWAEKEMTLDCNETFVPTLAERMSFAALQPVSGSTHSELLKLQKEKLQAMDLKDTSERLANSIELVKENVAIVVAKLAIQSLGA